MANVKISQLPLATSPLDSSVEMPVVQGGVTKRAGMTTIGFLQSGTSAVLRTAQAKMRETVSVKDFGAVGDGVTNDTAAIQAALNSSAVAIYFPAGRYIVTANLTRAGNTYIYGDTLTSSILQMNGTSSFVYSGGTAADEYGTDQLEIERLGFECPTVTAKSVIDAAWTDGIGGTSKTFIMRDCQVTGTNAAGGFGSAVTLTNARNIVVESVRILGDRDGAPISSQNGFNIVGTNPTGAPVEMYFNKVQVYFVVTAFLINGFVEGLYFTNITAVSIQFGIVANAAPSGRPLISVIGSHINSDRIGIRTTGFTQMSIAYNLLYAVNIDSTSTQYAAIELDGGAVDLDVQITDNNFQGILSGIPKNGVVILNGAATELSLIGGNIFVSFDTAIWLKPGTTSAVVLDNNLFRSCTTNILNNGTNDVCVAVLDSINGEKRFPDKLTEKWGTTTVTLNASGDGTVTFAPAFRTAFLNAVLCNGDPGTFGSSVFCVNQASSTASTLAFSLRPNPGAVVVRVNYVATGY